MEVIERHVDCSFIDNERQHMVINLEREVHCHRVLTDTERFEVPVWVPWSCSVIVAIPQSWWRRLLRRPVRYVHQRASGSAKATALVEVHADRYAAFPDLDVSRYPDSLGKAVMVSTWRPGEAASRREQTFPDDGVAEAWLP